jgi:hypothetical protein
MPLLLATVLGCNNPPVPTSTEAPSNLPRLELPAIDWRKEVLPAEEEKSPAALGRAVPTTEFVVEVELNRPLDGPPAQAGIFKILKRGRTGLYSVATCHLKPVSPAHEGVVKIQGICKAPVGTGDAIIEVRFFNKPYLVRSATIE